MKLKPITKRNYKQATIELWTAIASNEHAKDFLKDRTLYKNRLLNKLGYQACMCGCPLCKIHVSTNVCRGCPLTQNCMRLAYGNWSIYAGLNNTNSQKDAKQFLKELKLYLNK